MPVRVERRAIPRAGMPALKGEAMKVKMLETRDGSPDGIEINTYDAGEEYVIPARLGRIFVDEGWAEKLAYDDEDALADEQTQAEQLDDEAFASLTDEELVAKVLELDPAANADDVVQAVAANRAGVIEAAKELQMKSNGPAAENKKLGAAPENKSGKKPKLRGRGRRQS
jgi:hypothetical protein